MSVTSSRPRSRSISGSVSGSGVWSRSAAHSSRLNSRNGLGAAAVPWALVTRTPYRQVERTHWSVPIQLARYTTMLLTMCGIVGYVGSKQALGIVIEGLRRMEYRGYDSAGIAVVERADGEARLAGAKKAGKLANLEKELDARPLPASTTGLGHTRWATHGGPTDGNAHPHFSAPAEGVYTDTTGKVAVIHNGIIENFARLKAELTAGGVEFLSETDTEVVAHLLARDFAEAGDSDLGAAMRRVVNRLQGAFTLVAVHAEAPDVVVGARRNSPLVIGVGEGEAFLASDVSAFIAHTRE